MITFKADHRKRTPTCPKNQKNENETPKSSKPSRSQRTLDWETPKEELERSKLHKLDSRRRERSRQEKGQDKADAGWAKKKEKITLLITSFTAINESNDENENKTEESTGTVSPHRDSKPKSKDDRSKTTRSGTQYAVVARDEGVDISEESEEEVKVEPVDNQVVESSVDSEYLLTRVLTREYLFFDTF